MSQRERRCAHHAGDERRTYFNYRNSKEECHSRVGGATSVLAEEQTVIIRENGYGIEKANKLSMGQYH